MTTPLPIRLDVGDGLGIDRDLALQAAGHVLIATRLVLQEPELTPSAYEIAVSNLAYVLGGDHWADIAQALIDAALEVSRG